MDSLAKVVEDTLISMGVQQIGRVTYGNYDAVGSVCINVDTYVVTDLRKLMVRNQYLNSKWSNSSAL